MYNTRAQAALLQQGKRPNQGEVFVKPALPKRARLVTPGFGYEPDDQTGVTENAESHSHPNIPAGHIQQLPAATRSSTSRLPRGGGNNTAGNSNKRSRTIDQDSSGPSKDLHENRFQFTSSGSIQLTPAPGKAYGKPIVWANDRQALCEALPYYRAYQQGGYTSGGLGYGFLLDKDSGSRSYMDEEIVITRAGGGCKADEGGVMRQSTDQSINASHIVSFVNNKEKMVPVALIVGSSNDACPVVVPHRYCVMDWFQVTDIWAEKANGKTCFKFRFEKIYLNTKSWWAPEGSPLPPTTRPFKPAQRSTCTSCQHDSKKIFEEGWICLNQACGEFWMLNGTIAPAKLAYCKDFLGERTLWPAYIKPAFDLKPEPLRDDPDHATLAVSLAGWKGMVCPRCGRCNSRMVWSEWQCKTENCDFSHRIQLSPIPASAVLPDHAVEYVGHALPLDRYFNQVILREPEFLGQWRIHTYDLMAGNTLTHFHANSVINQRPGGAHDIFLALQAADLDLQRFPLKTSPVQGEMLTSHFATNFGMPYKYIVSVNSKPFSDAPRAVMNGLNRLTWAGKHAVGTEDYQNANELLALGYFEKQQIHYHDDGETDLGPTIATLSLGGEAEMLIRMKEKYFSSKRFNVNLQDANMDIVPGCQMYEDRMKLRSAYASRDPEEIRVALGLFKKRLATEDRTKLARPCLTLNLRHGDMVVMHGAGTQKFFEHEIIPKGKLRFALTSRFVDPAKIDKSEHWKGDFKFHPSEVYDGDVNLHSNLTGDSTPWQLIEPREAEPEVEVQAGQGTATMETAQPEPAVPVQSDLAMTEALLDNNPIDRAFLDQWEVMSGVDGY